MVELSDERLDHIRQKHPKVFGEGMERLSSVLDSPGQVRRDPRYPTTRLFSRWFEDAESGKFMVVTVVSDPPPNERHWIVTAYITRRLARGPFEWQRP